MNTIVHKANTRGDANHGWLKSKHTFSFANYYNPERMGFGALRVINDDHVEGEWALVLTLTVIWKSSQFQRQVNWVTKTLLAPMVSLKVARSR